MTEEIDHAPIKREIRVRPVIHWEVTDYTAKDGGKIEVELGCGIHFNFPSALNAAQAYEAREMAKPGVNTSIFKPVFDRLIKFVPPGGVSHNDIEKAAKEFERRLYGELSDTAVVIRAK